MRAWGNFTETQQSGHTSRSGPEVKNGSSAKEGTPERIRCRGIQEVSQILQRVSARAVRRILLPFYPAYIRVQEKAVTVAPKSGQFIADEVGKGQFL